MKNAHDVIRSLLRTEKGSVMQPMNKYLFVVSRDSNKVEIRHAVEEIYKVKVTDVNTSVMRGKKRRIRYAQGVTPDWKKAVVTLKDGDKIDIT